MGERAQMSPEGEGDQGHRTKGHGRRTLVLSPKESGDPAGLGTDVTHTSGGVFGNFAKGWGVGG